MTRRERVRACIHPETYKYFLERDRVLEIWARLDEAYGARVVTPGFGVVEIRTARLLLRATRMLNPVTVIRLRRCTDADIDALHERLDFRPDQQAA